MLVKPTQEELNKLARLSLDEFKPVRDFLERELEMLHKNLVTNQDPHTLGILQGRAREITEFLGIVEKARDLI